MMINPFVFRAYDVRGIYGKDIDEELFRKIGFVLGKIKEEFVVGNDIRKSGKKLARALIEGLTAAGAKVIYTGTTSSGQTLFAGWRLKVHASLFITASHLPPQWNGLKFYYGGGEPFSERDLEILKQEVMKIRNEKIKRTKINFRKIDIKNAYLSFFSDKFSEIKNNNLKIVLDCGNGAMSLVAPEVFKRLGFKVKELYCKPDPTFPNRSSELTPQSTKDLRKKVKKEKADFGVAFDGDGDRVIIIDDKGRYLKGDQIGTIIAKIIFKNSNNKKIIATLPCSMALEKELKGMKIIRVPVGHISMILGCKKEKAVFGMEETGHFCLPQYFLFDDAMLIPFKITEVMLKEKIRLSEAVDKMEIYPFEEVVFGCPDEIKFEVVEKLAEEFKRKYKKVNTLDGVKVSFDFGWILIRAANTSPKIRLYIEARTKEKFNFLKQKFSKILTEHINLYVPR